MKKGDLSEERIRLLDEIEFVWDPIEREWQINYDLAKKYVQENGNARIPYQHPTLGIWVSSQRNAIKKDKLSREKINLLDSIGFIWDPIEQEWQENYEELKRYADENGDTKVPATYPVLGRWVRSQRVAKDNGKLR